MKITKEDIGMLAIKFPEGDWSLLLHHMFTRKQLISDLEKGYWQHSVWTQVNEALDQVNCDKFWITREN